MRRFTCRQQHPSRLLARCHEPKGLRRFFQRKLRPRQRSHRPAFDIAKHRTNRLANLRRGSGQCSSQVNPTGYCNTEFDRLINDNRTTLDPAQRIKDLKDAQKIFYNDQPSLYVETRYSWVFHDSKLQDFHYANDGCVLFDRLWMKR